MKKTLILAVGCGLFASVAFAQTPPAGAPSAQDFVNKVAVSDMFEIQSSQIALAKQADADTKPFAEKMVQDHQKTSSELKALVDSGKGQIVRLPDYLRAPLSRLNSKPRVSTSMCQADELSNCRLNALSRSLSL